MCLPYLHGGMPGSHMANKLPEANEPKAAIVWPSLWENASPILTLT